MKLGYSSEAIAALQRLYEFLLPKSPLAAKKAAITIQEAAEKLKLFPNIGLPVSTAPEPELVRDLYVGDYTVRYQIDGQKIIYILRIWHNKEIEKDITYGISD